MLATVASRQPPSHSHRIGWFASAGFCRPGLSEVEIHVSCLWFGLFVSIVTTITLLQKSPQGEGVEDTLDRPQ